MPKPKKNVTPIQEMISSPGVPFEQRLELLRGLVNNDSEEAKLIVASLLESLGAAEAETHHIQMAKKYAELIREIQEGPLRHATFIELLPTEGRLSGMKFGPTNGESNPPLAAPLAELLAASVAPHALVLLDDGTAAYTVVPNAELAKSLRLGDRVVIEGKGRALLCVIPKSIRTGEEATFERRIDDRHVEVTVRGHERCVYLGTADLMVQIHAGAVPPGTALVVNPRQFIAYAALPPQDGYAHYRYLARTGVPDVVVERDIGAPPKSIQQLSDLIRLEMLKPDLRRRYKLRRCIMRLLSGVSGSGKTLAVQAIWRRMYEIMSEVTGLPIAQLPPRVFRLNMAQVLSMWLGESDKNLDRFFAEVEQLADEEWTAPDGRKFRLPVLAILEEIDGLARARGHEPIYDRILTTALQRLDATRPELKDKLIIYIGTTNEAQNVDRAFLRRIGGTVEQFGRLKRGAFRAVLQKHLCGLPLRSNNGCTEEQVQARYLAALTDWLFCAGGQEPALVEMLYANSTTPVPKYRRDFLTGALIDRAVQEAADAAVMAEDLGLGEPGVSLELLMHTFDEQVRSVVEQLNEYNATSYLDVPSGVRVASVRKLPQPTHLPVELQRT
jgi:hypothetical protein